MYENSKRETYALRSKCSTIRRLWLGMTTFGSPSLSVRKRNFENGVLSDDPALLEPLVEQFDSVWRGDFCRDCGRRDFCSDPAV